MADIKLRFATEDDVPALVAMGRLMHAESRYSYTHYSEHKVGGQIRFLLEAGRVFVADQDGEIVGTIMGMLTQWWFSEDPVVIDFALYVAPEFRQLGVARMLIYAMQQWAKEHDATLDIGISSGVQIERTGLLCESMGGVKVGGTYTWRPDHVR